MTSSAQGTALGRGQITPCSADDGDVDVTLVERAVADDLETPTRRRRLCWFATNDHMPRRTQLGLGGGTDSRSPLDQQHLHLVLPSHIDIRGHRHCDRSP